VKYSFMTFSTPELDWDEVLDLAARLGYDGVEPRIVAKHRHGIETDLDAAGRAEAKRKAAERGVAIACVATSCRFADPETTGANVADALEAIDLAADLGCPRIRVFGGQLGKGIERAEAIRVVSDALESVASRAAERGVDVCMETHDDWCDPKHVAAVMERVGHPNITVNWDILHPVRNDLATVDESFDLLRPWIRHVHVHDYDVKPMGNLVPIGTGYVDHCRAVALLEKIGYDGFLSGEWINWADPYETHLPRELATLRGYETSRA
jgi:sugar phosphate isomerase/epimerase